MEDDEDAEIMKIMRDNVRNVFTQTKIRDVLL